MTRLTYATLDRLPKSIPSPLGRTPPTIGIVHFGPGAFHRAHQAAYVDALLADDPRWGIAAVSMRSKATVAALAEQDGLYTLAVRDADSSNRVIGAHRRFLGPDDAAQTHALLADPAVRLVTSTVTEKGYCLAADGTLDLSHADIVHDLAGTATPRSLIGWLVAGLDARRVAGIAPFVPMPCDNLANNGAKLHAALVAYARSRDARLADWIAGEVRVPSTMVDSITPASDAALYADVAETLGLEDRAAVQRESFVQWVIEDIGVPLGPDLASVGATITRDVASYEKAKLRILNGAHSTLAYVGLLRSATSVADAMRDADLAGFVDAMIRDNIMPMLPATAGLDLDAYRAAVLQRFRNPVIVHRLDQIAQDGSQKLSYRLGDTLIANRREGRMPAGIVTAFGAWVAFLIRQARAGTPIVDPAGEHLAAAARDGTPADVVARLIDAALGFPPELRGDDAVRAAVADAAERIARGNWSALEARHAD
ncbi:fructuronate reductase [Sphingomonas sp. PP-CE-3G-477]|uniref:mannitol dehydrogenase family protein n=1 Tax=Sphingomonas sp. PP-CE-3G-477 TaxID=2135660 RepID=UPI000D358E7E|nr:mannitol dehydrogenase family protein [Sphingomonas sp. PP-CE-3G-477]PTQ65820.1 fructuronate reductase [Sphingomonas sp. PP-CE-3G-477]